MNYSFEQYRRRDRILKRLNFNFLINLMDSIKTKRNLIRNAKKTVRYLEIGPGLYRIKDFETLNIIDGRNVDYIMDISKPLLFEDNSFDLIYASHVIEHVPWFLQKQLFDELYRVLKPGGILEIWVPDFEKVLKTINEYLNSGVNGTDLDGWYRFNPEHDVFIWANGRIFTYGDGNANPMSFNWHRCVYHPLFLKKLFEDSNFLDIKRMDNSEVRGFDHGWINLGMKARK